MLHAQFGRKWMLPEFESMEEMQQRYEEVRAGYQAIIERDQALPRATWWDDFYRKVPREQEQEAPT